MRCMCASHQECNYHAGCSDTAGLRGSSDPIEQEGVKRALKKYVFYVSMLFSINWGFFTMKLSPTRKKAMVNH